MISTVCELFFTKEVPCFPLQDIFISGKVLVLAFLSDPSNLWLDIFCSRYGFFSFVLSLISTVNYSLLKKCLVSHCKIFHFIMSGLFFDYLLMLIIFPVQNVLIMFLSYSRISILLLIIY